MSHMPSYGSAGSNCDSGCTGAPRLVPYTATGAEGVDFFVPIVDDDGDPVTLADDEYEVGFFGARGAAMIPAVWDFPNAVAGDRTQTQFRVLVPDVLSAGDVFLFEIVS